MADLTLEQFAARLDAAAKSGELDAAIASGLRLCEPIAVAGYRRHFAEQRGPDGQPWAPIAHSRVGRGAGGEKALWDTGRMMASGVAKATGNVLELGTNLVQAGLMQFGGQIVPRNVTYLTIPATAESRRAGSRRRDPRELSPRVNRRRGKGVLVDDAGEVQYYLTKGPIRVPARVFVGFSAETLAEIGEAVIDHILKTVMA